jgi:hypothetical protein
MGFFSHLRSSESVQWASFPIPAARVLDERTDAEADSFIRNESYCELRVSQMYLRDRREYLRGFVPLASVLTRFQFAGQRRVLTAIVGPQTFQEAPHVREEDPVEILNKRVAGPFPYEGEDLELFAGLFRVQVQDWATQALSFAETIGKALDVTKLSSYLNVADAVSNAVYDLLGMSELEFRLGSDRTFIGVGGGGDSASLLRPGFDVIVGADEAKVPQATRDRLWVKDARLHIGDSEEELERWREHDFLLLRTAALTRRDDYTSFRFHAVHWPRVQEHVWAGRQDEARAELALLGAELARSVDITRRHRMNLIAQYRAWYLDETAQYEALTSGAGEHPAFDDTGEPPGPLGLAELDLAAAVDRAGAAPGDDDASLLALLSREA